MQCSYFNQMTKSIIGTNLFQLFFFALKAHVTIGHGVVIEAK